MCPECQGKLPWLSGGRAEREVELTEGCVSVLEYDDLVKKGVHAFKFHGKSARSGAFGSLMAQAVRDSGLAADLESQPLWPSAAIALPAQASPP